MTDSTSSDPGNSGNQPGNGENVGQWEEGKGPASGTSQGTGEKVGQWEEDKGPAKDTGDQPGQWEE